MREVGIEEHYKKLTSAVMIMTKYLVIALIKMPFLKFIFVSFGIFWVISIEITLGKMKVVKEKVN